MTKKQNTTGGDTQAIDDEKPKKPKMLAQVTLSIRDDGALLGDFWVWRIDEHDRRKKWTSTGTEFFECVNLHQPKQIRSLASCLNLQIVQAGLSEDLQGPWISIVNGVPRVLEGEALQKAMAKAMANNRSEKVAAASDAHAARIAGLTSEGPIPV